MRYFRRLLPLLRTADGFERVSIFAGVVLVEIPFVLILWPSLLWFSSHPSLDASRVEVVAANLGLLCLVAAFVVRLYSTRILQLDGRPFALRSWQRLIGATVLVTLLPICAIVLALAIPPTSDAFQFVFPISLIGAVVLLVAYLSTYSRRQTAD